MTYLISGIVLTVWGIWCLVAAALKKGIQIEIFYNHEFILKKIFGKYYETVMNIVFGIICTMFGLFFLFG